MRKDEFFAGYEWGKNSQNDATGVTTSFVVPPVKNCTQTNTGILPGVTVAIIPAPRSVAGLFVGCSGGRARYFPVLAINGSVSEFKSLRARPGDAIAVTATENENLTRVSVKDRTRTTASKTLTGAGSGNVDATSDPVIGDLAWPLLRNAEGPVPNFGKISFSGSKIDALPLGSYGAELTHFNLYDDPTLTTLEVSAGNLASNGQSFKTTFVNP